MSMKKSKSVNVISSNTAPIFLVLRHLVEIQRLCIRLTCAPSVNTVATRMLPVVMMGIDYSDALLLVGAATMKLECWRLQVI